MLSLKFNVHIELVGWEDTVSSAGRPQEIINRDLERCDVFIGLLWKRWGSAPDNESKYESGFEEEFTLATTGHKKTKKPLISLFFKKIDTPALSDPGEQLQKVIRFKNKIIEEKLLLFQEFETTEQFESFIRKCISNYVLDHIDVSDSQPQATQAPEAESENPKNEEREESFDFSPIQKQSANFVQSILRRSGDASTRAKLEPFEVARLRLIANGLGDGQNDQSYLGAHDANLIYKNKDLCSFESAEIHGLLKAGAKNLKHENIPIWYWLQHQGREFYNLSFLTLAMPDDHSTVSSVLDLMTLGGIEIETDILFTRRVYLDSWLSEKKNFYIKNSALRYLSENGIEEDLAEIQKEIDRNSSQTIALAHEAYISIKLKNGLGSGLEALNLLQPTVLGDDIIERLFENYSHITTQDLLKLVEHRNKKIRSRTLKILSARELLPKHIIELAQQDPEPEVRALSIPALLQQGVNLGEDEAKAIIMKDVSKSTTEEEAAWAEIQPMLLGQLETSELERRAHKYLPLRSDAYIELARRKLDKLRPELTQNLQNNYEDFYYKHLRSWAEATNDAPEQIFKQFESLKQFITIGFTRKTLTLLTENKSTRDLATIRSTLSNPSIPTTESDLKYFQQHGEWKDIPLIIEIVSRFGASGRRSLLGGNEVPREIYALTVKIILKIGKDRIADVLALKCPSMIKRNAISSMRDKDFLGIGEDVILGILHDEDPDIRKHCALKCAKLYSKKKLSELLERYRNAEQTFYNVIHWLDFGIYGTKEQVKNICSKIFIL